MINVDARDVHQTRLHATTRPHQRASTGQRTERHPPTGFPNAYTRRCTTNAVASPMPSHRYGRTSSVLAEVESGENVLKQFVSTVSALATIVVVAGCGSGSGSSSDP